ncbi:MAG: sterol desaturase family protein [Bacteroidia bacterium]|nr:sterol desaturase family protein [Bacteroidia bacterium]
MDLKLILHVKGYYLQCLIIFIISDFKEYIRHAIFHKVGPLWKLHEFHHSATDLNMITNYRGHFLETALAKFFDVIPYIILGAPIHSYILITSFVEIHHLFVHSSVKSDWGFIGKYFLVSPAAHRIHHSTKNQHYNKNLGATLIIWDKLFNTFNPSEIVSEVGIPNNPYNKRGYINDIFICIKRFAKCSIHDIGEFLKKYKS